MQKTDTTSNPSEQRLAWQNREKKFSCPRCSSLFKFKKMEKVHHPSGALLDVCPKCGGMWIDKNEVRALYNYSKKVKK